jgi:hypothetical protein
MGFLRRSGRYNCFIMRRLCDRGLSSGTSPERIAPESVTPMYVPLRSPQHIGQIARPRTRSSLTRAGKQWFGGEFLKSFARVESNQKQARVNRNSLPLALSPCGRGCLSEARAAEGLSPRMQTPHPARTTSAPPSPTGGEGKRKRHDLNSFWPINSSSPLSLPPPLWGRVGVRGCLRGCKPLIRHGLRPRHLLPQGEKGR